MDYIASITAFHWVRYFYLKKFIHSENPGNNNLIIRYRPISAIQFYRGVGRGTG